MDNKRPLLTRDYVARNLPDDGEILNLNEAAMCSLPDHIGCGAVVKFPGLKPVTVCFHKWHFLSTKLDKDNIDG